MWDEELLAMRSSASKAVSSHLSPTAHEVLRLSIQWPDSFLASTIVKGSQLVGDIPKTHIYRPASAPASVTVEELFAISARRRAAMDSRRPPPPEEAEAIWAKSEEERLKGWLLGWYSAEQLDGIFGQGAWSFMVRFAVWQEGAEDWRAIDNAKASSQNAATSSSEKIHTTSINVSVAIWKFFRDLYGGPLVGTRQSKSATKDKSKAYRQLGVADEHLRHSIVCVWHPRRRMWVYGILLGLAFGEVVAVLMFNRYPALLVALARRWLAIPVINFYDDFKIHDVDSSGNSASYFFDQLASTPGLGWRFSSNKNAELSTVCKFLGVLEDHSFTGNELIKLYPDEKRISTIVVVLLRVSSTQALDIATASSLHGKLQHLNAVLCGNFGRSQLAPLSDFAAGKHVPMSRILSCVNFWLCIFSHACDPWKYVSLHGQQRRTVHLYTDASNEPRDGQLPVVQCSFLLVDVASCTESKAVW